MLARSAQPAQATMVLFNLGVAASPIKRGKGKVRAASRRIDTRMQKRTNMRARHYAMRPHAQPPCGAMRPPSRARMAKPTPMQGKAGPALAKAAARKSVPTSRWESLAGLPRTIRSRLLAHGAK